ncbi:acyltransferase family protein [Pseudonocardia sp. N23]|uniref:acyltransferase family protein n=1 Tax=Pseudonocardia sp. N23 TaxID=1987376 RepID=UPI00209BC11A|nr:acyltransferase family protein [Pseudonocardia sp. N23]
MTAMPAPPVGTTDVRSERRYRPELQGLRALAVGLVVVYHVWFDRISGGVDVFFLVSGFLITGQLYRSAQRGSVPITRNWGRQIARLVPAVAVVLVATVVAGLAILPEARWVQTVREVVASAFFLENWRLAADSVDYSAQHNTASVVQHFWSLSIQVQFYVVWPLLIAGVVLVAGRDRLDRTLTRVLAALFGVSLAYSVVLTTLDQPLAYFHSLTRVWEFALGGLLALWIDRVDLPARVRVLLGWLGVLGLVACGAVLQVGSVFPGYAALWPTGAAALVLLAGATGSPRGADRLLSTAPLRYLGNISYSLYLWHWPVLLFFLALTGEPSAGLEGGTFVIVLSLLLAMITYHVVEEPMRLRHESRRAQYRLGAVAVVLVLLATGAWQGVAMVRADHGAVIGDATHPGAMALVPGYTAVAASDEPVEPLPPMVSLGEDWGRTDSPWTCGADPLHPPLESCTLPADGPPQRRVVVVGDSHSQQYLGALQPIARQNRWEITTFLKGACPFSTASETDPGSAECLAWNTALVPAVVELHPDVVFTMGSREVRTGLTEATPPGYVEAWSRLAGAGIPVLAVRDNPRFDFRPADCVAENGRGAPQCGAERNAWYPEVPSWAGAPGVPADVRFLDFSDLMCAPDGQCPAEIGNVWVYMDDNHLSATFTASMAPVVEQRIVAAMGW